MDCRRPIRPSSERPPSHKAGRHPPCSLTPQGLLACRPDQHRQHPACPDLEDHPLHPTQRKDSPPPSAPNGRPPFPLRPATWMQAQADTHPSPEAKGTPGPSSEAKGWTQPGQPFPHPTGRLQTAAPPPIRLHHPTAAHPPSTATPHRSARSDADRSGRKGRASELEADRPAGEGVVVGA